MSGQYNKTTVVTSCYILSLFTCWFYSLAAGPKFWHLGFQTQDQKGSVKMVLHEECGCIKFYWTISLADSCTLNGMYKLKYIILIDSYHS